MEPDSQSKPPNFAEIREKVDALAARYGIANPDDRRSFFILLQLILPVSAFPPGQRDLKMIANSHGGPRPAKRGRRSTSLKTYESLREMDFGKVSSDDRTAILAAARFIKAAHVLSTRGEDMYALEDAGNRTTARRLIREHYKKGRSRLQAILPGDAETHGQLSLPVIF